MIVFEHNEPFDSPRAEVWAWHARPGAFRRLAPPWQDVRPVSEPAAIEDGSRMVFDLRAGPLTIRWVAEHRRVVPGEAFDDVQVRGPFRSWHHHHRFVDAPHGGCEVRDRLEIGLPGGRLVEPVAGAVLRRDLERLFTHRGAVLRSDLRLHRDLAATRPWTIVISGAETPLGQTLLAMATTGGHRVLRLVRDTAARHGDIRWRGADGVDPRDLPRLEGVDALVHLAADDLRTSRLVASLGMLKVPPPVLVTASSVAWYGERGDRELDETADSGAGILARRADRRETEASGASTLGVRIVNLRLGALLTLRGGALPALLGLGPWDGGDGDRPLSWISVDDAAGMILHLIAHGEIQGPVNGTTPEPVALSTLRRKISRVLGLGRLLRLPAPLARLVRGEPEDPAFLTSTRAVPTRLVESGYRFRHTDVEQALRHLLGRHGGAERT